MNKIITLVTIPLLMMANESSVEQLFSVQTVQVKIQNSTKKQVNHGYIVANESNIFDVTTRYSGFVEELYVTKTYDKVKKGDPLVKVYSPTVYKAKIDYLNSLKYKSKIGSNSMISSAKKKLKLLNVAIKEIDDIEKYNGANEFTTIYAKNDGWIFKKNINTGSSFKSGEKLFEIVNTDTLWANIELYQNQLKEFNKFVNFTIKSEATDEIYIATNPLIYPNIDPKVATATLRVNIDNKLQHLKPGMYVKLYSKQKSTDTLVIPKTAAILKNGTWYAFLATEFRGIYEPIKIDVTPIDNSYYKVISGLTTDDKVVNNALFMMDSDAQINALY